MAFKKATDILCHWGIIGQRWGVRRYQNKDGTLTSAGKKHYNTEDGGKATVSKIYDNQLGAEKQIFSGTKDAANAAANSFKGGTKAKKKDYSGITDNELRDRINRLRMEDEYGRLSGDTKYVKSGSEWVRESLQTIGALSAIGVSTVSIIQGIKRFKGGS